MSSRIKSWKITLLRHLLVGLIAIGLIYIGWLVHSTWSPHMRLWKAFGVASFFLLFIAVSLGPLSKLIPQLIKYVSWRREFGIWFALIGLVHGYLIIDGWARWSFWEFLGYQYVADLDMYLRFEPGFGLANMIGLFALFLGLVLAATSSDKAIKYLGISSWKWLHGLAYVIFYLSAFHVLYFAFIHYSVAPHRLLMGMPSNYPLNPLRFYYLGATLIVFFAQTFAFIKIVIQRKRNNFNAK